MNSLSDIWPILSKTNSTGFVILFASSMLRDEMKLTASSDVGTFC